MNWPHSCFSQNAPFQISKLGFCGHWASFIIYLNSLVRMFVRIFVRPRTRLVFKFQCMVYTKHIIWTENHKECGHALNGSVEYHLKHVLSCYFIHNLDHYVSIWLSHLEVIWNSAEFAELQQHLQEYQVLWYEPPAVVKQTYKDGGVAIIEQIICSHARYHMCHIIDWACPTCSCTQAR